MPHVFVEDEATGEVRCSNCHLTPKKAPKKCVGPGGKPAPAPDLTE